MPHRIDRASLARKHIHMVDEMHPHVHHGFDYVIIPALDLDIAEEFYTHAFGWRFNPFGPGYLEIITPDGRGAGGISLTGEIPPSGVLVVLFSRDLEATYQGVLDAGGTITRETFEFPGGIRFHFADPSGNELGVWAFHRDQPAVA